MPRAAVAATDSWKRSSAKFVDNDDDDNNSAPSTAAFCSRTSRVKGCERANLVIGFHVCDGGLLIAGELMLRAEIHRS